MKIVNVDSFCHSDKILDWLKYEKGVFSPVVPSKAFAGNYSVDATVAANTAEGFLSLFFDDKITSGNLWVQLMVPYESGSLEIFNFMVKAAEGVRLGNND